jgi:putative membrane protein
VSFGLRLIIAWGVNLAALWAANALFDDVRIKGWTAYLLGSAVLGVANAILKPLLAILTLPLIIVTLGLFYLVINIGMVALAAWVTPNFSIHGFWTYLGAVAVIWAVNWIAGQILGDLERHARPRLV